MTATTATTTFVTSRTVDAAADDAAAGLDRLRRDRAGEVSVPGERGLLVLGEALPVPAGGELTRYVAARRYAATLQVAPWRRVPVEFEILPWSDDRAELLLRPARAPRAKAYFAEAEAALRRLAEQIERRALLSDLEPVESTPVAA